MCDTDLRCCIKCPGCAFIELDTRRRHEFRVKNPYWMFDVSELLIRKYTRENPLFLLKIYPNDRPIRKYVFANITELDF